MNEPIRSMCTSKTDKALLFCLLILLACVGCSGTRSIGIPTGEYYGNSVTIRFHDSTFEYIKKEGSLTLSEYATGIFEFISRDKIALIDTTSSELRMTTYVSVSPIDKSFNTITIELANNAFDIEKLPTQFFKIDLYINGQRFKTLEQLESQFTFQERIDSLWLSAVVRTALSENAPKTLLSTKITDAQIGDRFCDIQIESDFSLTDFYRIKFQPDTLILKSKERIYWPKRNLTLYKRQ
jgi:hypothetical protein